MADAAPKRHGRWALPAVLLAAYIFLRLQAWGYVQQTGQLEKELDRLRPALSAMVLAEQLENTRRACQRVSDQVHRLDLQNEHLFERLSLLPASITLKSVENRTRLKTSLQRTFFSDAGQSGPALQSDLKIEGTLLPGIRNPELVLVLWAQTLESEESSVRIRRLFPSPEDPSVWSFELSLEGA